MSSSHPRWLTDELVELAAMTGHVAYEAAAAGHGWETNERSRVPWQAVPEANRQTMRDAYRAALSRIAPTLEDSIRDTPIPPATLRARAARRIAEVRHEVTLPEQQRRGISLPLKTLACDVAMADAVLALVELLTDVNDAARQLEAENAPHAFIQWKGTDVCLDFTCECGWEGHLDGYFAYAVRCGGCGKVWDMPHHVRLATTAGYHAPMDPESSMDWTCAGCGNENMTGIDVCGFCGAGRP